MQLHFTPIGTQRNDYIKKKKRKKEAQQHIVVVNLSLVYFCNGANIM